MPEIGLSMTRDTQCNYILEGVGILDRSPVRLEEMADGDDMMHVRIPAEILRCGTALSAFVPVAFEGLTSH